MTATYWFLPWVRRGAAAAVDTVDTLGTEVPGRARLPLTLRVDGAEIRPDVALHGPGDVIGLDARQVVHTDPADRSTGVETTRFAAVEFRSPTLPWLFTPATADRRGRLRPWLCLVVVPADLAAAPLPQADDRPPSFTAPAGELPDLAESWAWAHTQVVADDADTPVVELLDDDPDRAVSRLVCPRRLRPNTRYRACVVPSFDAGRKAGLGEEVSAEDEAALRPAWTRSAQQPVTLPVYYHWEFETGERGDFASLASRLRHKAAPEGVGVRAVDVSALLADGDAGRSAVLAFTGALRPVGGEQPPSDDAEATLAAASQTLRRELEASADDDLDEPKVGPPLYGSWQTAQDELPAPGKPLRWLGELNVDPRHRAAAALGTLVVRDQQQYLMASAWEQAGEIEGTNQALRSSQLAREADRGAHRRLAALPAADLVGVTGQVHPRVLWTTTTTSVRLRASGLPAAATSPTFRRIARPRGPLARRAGVGGQTLAAAALADLAARSLSAAPMAVNPRDLDAPDNVLTAQTVRERLASDPHALDDEPLGTGFEDALQESAGWLHDATAVTQPGWTPPLRPADIAERLLDRLDPDETVRARVLDRLAEREPPRSEATDPLEPVMAAPTFPQPMFAPLRDLGLDALAAGLEGLPADSVTLLETNPGFVEAFMVGLNHEMSRELLWRGFPTDQRASYFPHFWEPSETDPPSGWQIHEWDDPQRSLGDNHPDAADAGGLLVLVLRGELLRRYPDAGVYVAKAVVEGGELVPGRQERQPRFQGSIDPDITFVGFDLTADEARSSRGDKGWFFVIEQPASEPGFGIDPDTSDPAELESWESLTWGHLTGAHDAVAPTHAPIAGPLDDERLEFEGLRWGLNAAHMARITLQRPVRVAIHADELLASDDDEEER